MMVKELLLRCEAGLFLDPDEVNGPSGGTSVTAMVYLPQRAENSREEFADGFHIQYGTLHGWGEYEISVWACTQEINALEWRRFIQAVEQAGGSIDMDEKALET